ncbi:MAG: DUF2961 domain-containing protein [Balneolaceae bacterium]
MYFKKITWNLFFFTILISGVQAQETHNGLDINMNNLYQLSDAKTRSISPENFTGEKGKGGMATLEEGNAANAARDLGQGWKVNPFIIVEAGESFTLGEINESGIIQHIWMTATGNWRYSILKMYWDGEEEPSVEAPVGDFFAQGWGRYSHINSLPISVNPGSGFNSYWQMPFRENAKITITNKDTTQMRLYYQIDYALTEIPDDAAYFHAQFRRVNPLPYKELYTIVDNVKGKGHYVGTYLAHGANSPGWWGEGEVKFFIDGDTDFPTINGTGEEDYFLGSYSYSSLRPDGTWGPIDFTTPYAGYHQILDPDTDIEQRRFGQYRWHIPDPIRFEEDLEVNIQSLGWQTGGRYLPLQDDLASVAYWYQTEPHEPFPEFPTREDLTVSWSSPLNHLGKVSDIELEHGPNSTGNGEQDILLDGKVGSIEHDDSKWLGFEGNDFVAVLDLKMRRAVQEIAVRFLEDQNEEIFHPQTVEIFISEDGENFEAVYMETNEIIEQYGKQIQTIQTALKHKEARYVKIVAENIGECPDWHQNAGNQAWLLADEIIIR